MSGQRLGYVAANVRTAVRRARQALADANRDGFAGVEERIRHAVLGSERLVDVTERLAVQGLRPRSPEGAPVTPEEVQATVSGLRSAVGALAMATAVSLSTYYGRYVESVEALAALAERILASGLTVASKGDSEWEPFRSRAPKRR